MVCPQSALYAQQRRGVIDVGKGNWAEINQEARVVSQLPALGLFLTAARPAGSTPRLLCRRN